MLLETVEPHCEPPEESIPGANRRDESLHAQHYAVFDRMNVPLPSYDLHDERLDGLAAAQVYQSAFMLYAKHISEFNIIISLFYD